MLKLKNGEKKLQVQVLNSFTYNNYIEICTLDNPFLEPAAFFFCKEQALFSLLHWPRQVPAEETASNYGEKTTLSTPALFVLISGWVVEPHS